MAKMKEVLVRIKQYFTRLENGKADKVANATENNIALFDSNGNVKDSGKSINDVGKVATVSVGGGTPIQPDQDKNIDLPAYPTRVSLSINNVDNTSDSAKPVSTAQQTAIDSTGHKIDLEINNTTFKIKAKLYDKNNTLISTSNEIDLPLESVVVGGRYDSVNKKVVLTLQNGTTIEFSVADLIYGLQSEITAQNPLSSDLVDDTNNSHKFVSANEKATWNGKQNAIADLETIRRGASAGATAVQDSNYVHTDNNYTNVDKQKLADLENYDDTQIRNLINSNWGTYKGYIQNTDIDTLTDRGVYSIHSNCSNQPIANSYGKLLVFDWSNDGSYPHQIFIVQPDANNRDKIFIRGYNGSTWNSWRELDNNKPLYFNGAFDSDDGKTRQTGYKLLGNNVEIVSEWQSTGNGYWVMSIALPNCDKTSLANVIANCRIWTDQPSYWSQTFTGFLMCVGTSYSESGYIIIAYGGATTHDQLISALAQNPITIQYKLATPYTDDGIIEGETILPLDSNMANKIRQDVVDGLNLLDTSNAVNGHYSSGEYGVTSYTIGVGSVNITNRGSYGYNAVSIKFKTIAGAKYTFTANVSETTRVVFGDYQNNTATVLIDDTSYTSGKAKTFTALSNETWVLIYADQTISCNWTNIMLVEVNHPYPYSLFNQKEHITNKQAELLKQEEEKCRNLFNNTTDYTYSGYGVDVNVNGNQCVLNGTSNGGYFQTIATYTLQAGTYSYKQYILSGSSVDLTKCRFGLQDTDNNYIPLGLESGNFTLNQTTTFNIVVWWGESGIAFNNTKLAFMLNAGNTPEPYQEWNGKIIHEKDLATLLWTNPSPNSEFASQTINVDMTNYKYIIIEYKRISDSDWQETAIKKLGVAVRPREAQIGFSLFEVDIAGDIYYRAVSFASLTQLVISNAKYKPDNSSVNGWLIPVKIYGTNIP